MGRNKNKHSEHGEHSVVSAGVSGVGKELLGCQGILELRPGPAGAIGGRKGSDHEHQRLKQTEQPFGLFSLLRYIV